MKILGIIILIACHSTFSLAQVEKDPFEEKKKESIVADSQSVHFARKWVDEKQLAAFGEPNLGVAGEGYPCYRIFIQLESSNPVLLKYLVPSLDRKSTIIEMKQLSKVNGDWKLASKKSCAVDKDLCSLLQVMLELSNPMRLPVPDWEKEDMLDGTRWLYEFPVPDGFIVFARKNPLGVGPEDALVGSGVSMERYARELQLTTFVMMLCSKIGGKFDFSKER